LPALPSIFVHAKSINPDATSRWDAGPTSREIGMSVFGAILGHSSQVDPTKLAKKLDGLLLDDEVVSIAFKTVRDYFVFTQKRVIMVDVQGITGRKTEYRTIPYRAIVGYSLETAGTLDMDAELKIWVSGNSAPIEKSLDRTADVKGIQKALSIGVLV
jgi:hypothetical protein